MRSRRSFLTLSRIFFVKVRTTWAPLGAMGISTPTTRRAAGFAASSATAFALSLRLLGTLVRIMSHASTVETLHFGQIGFGWSSRCLWLPRVAAKRPIALGSARRRWWSIPVKGSAGFERAALLHPSPFWVSPWCETAWPLVVHVVGLVMCLVGSLLHRLSAMLLQC